MSWDTPPSSSLGNVRVRETVASVLERAAGDLLDALVDGTPVQSGRLRDSWRILGGGTELSVEATAPYAEFVAIDTSGADGVIADADREIVNQLETQFGGR